MCDKFEAKPRVGVRKEELELYMAFTSLSGEIEKKRLKSHLMGRCRKTRRRAHTAIYAAIATVRAGALSDEDGLQSSYAASL